MRFFEVEQARGWRSRGVDRIGATNVLGLSARCGTGERIAKPAAQRRRVRQEPVSGNYSAPASNATGRTSTPVYFASGICAANSSARSLLATSTT